MTRACIFMIEEGYKVTWQEFLGPEHVLLIPRRAFKGMGGHLKSIGMHFYDLVSTHVTLACIFITLASILDQLACIFLRFVGILISNDTNT